jgi:starvation-inducible DNA-binding protein
MEQLVEALKKAQATSFAFYLKAHNYHWNVEGANFAEYHGFLGDLYAEVWGAVDAIAEHIRTLDAYAPGSFTRFQQLSSIEDEMSVPSGRAMMAKLLADNQPWNLILFMAIPVILAETIAVSELYVLFTRNLLK